ncbi:PAS domain-containing protein [Halodesulfurarchaeum sp. HSR-GB]|uniref:hybrid sensor histidine kinase/response regulator n=1 Tax=Halodesulfurarchaeum sp. HSR-GB TaxID=3074077 RepID=UPI002862C57E|nr:PAS domain-containing protein [Halodesulfurarchaeum sp. HSR-GB]MDR5657728.1 PAS domain-containing protein [Halodesulfurarchaeum sp. HSR-GB]
MSTTTEKIHVLHVDDELNLTELVADFLEREDDRISVQTATSASAGLESLSDTDVDCIISDYDMPGQSGIEFLETVREDRPDLPFILYTGKGSEEVASDAISSGVTDYLQKESGTEQYGILANRVVNAVERYRATQHIERQNDLFRKAQDIATVGAWEYDIETETFYNSEEVLKIHGLSPEENMSAAKSFEYYHPEDRPTIRTAFQKAIEEGKGYDLELRVVDEVRAKRWVRTRGEPQYMNGEIVRIRGTIQDITERKEQEKELKKLKERYESLFEENPLVIWEEDLSTTKQRLDELSAETDSVEQYLRENPSILKDLLRTAEIIGVNQTAVDYFAANSKEELMANFEETLTETAYEIIAAEFAAIANGETRFRAETVSKTLQGDRRDELLNVYVPESANDDYSRVFVTTTDIGERKEREQELQNRTEQIQNVIDSVEGAMWIRNEDGEYMYMNQYHRDLFDIPDDVKVAGKRFADLLPAEVAGKFQENDQRVYETEEPVEIEETVETDDGPIHFLTRIVPLFENGSVYATCGIATDVTEQKNRERQLEKFANIVSHDLRNPLNVASGRLDLAAEDCDSEHLDAIERAHDRMAMLIEDLLTLAREGEVIADTNPVDLDSVVEGCWANVETAGNTLVADIERTVQADESRLEQVFENLIRNAIDHGGEDVTVTVGALAEGFYVEDDGPGIPPEAWEDIFETGYSTTEDGTGFGLSIVKQIVDAHDWNLHVTEGADGGARFEITDVEFAAE